MRKLGEYATVVWDFNGTLLDDVGIGIDSANALLGRRGLPLLADRAAYRSVFCFPIEEYYRRLGFDFSREPFSVLAHEWVAEYRRREHTCRLYPDAEALLSAIHEKGIPQVILSATEERMLREQLDALGILPFFDERIGRSDIYAEDKTALARAFAARHPGERMLMIGDTGHDLASARAAGWDIILVRDGHSSDEALDALGCEVAENLRDVGRRLGVW